ncbi:DUF4349 domain-containing protein [Ornithinimicrobium sp. LYQ92]|uniref:DUF4349 domain-containing protein n=1 Tax=Serinicoccus sp. LYQ92 TaxID=3378798 RepID=UPI003851D677
MRTRMIAGMLAGVLVLAGCSSDTGGGDQAESVGAGADSAGADDSGSAGEDMGAEDAGGEDAGGGEDGSSGDEAAGVGSVDAASLETTGPLMVRSVELDLVVDDVGAAVTRARATAVGLGGWVSSEDVRPGGGSDVGADSGGSRGGYGSMVLRVPSEDLDAAVTSLEELGEVQASRSSAQDVTTEYRDVEARVATLEAGAERLRELVAEAPSVEAVASLESELAQRESDLDALKARLKVLSEDVSRSTITLHLAQQGEDLGETRPDTGFVAGLGRGWDAFTGSVSLVLTATGALLPFLALAALLGLPVLWWRRRSAR